MSCIHSFFFFFNTRCFVEINTFLSNACQKNLLFPTAFYLMPKLFICYTDKYCIVFIVGEWQGKSGSQYGGIHSGANIPTDKSQMGALRVISSGTFWTCWQQWWKMLCQSLVKSSLEKRGGIQFCLLNSSFISMSAKPFCVVSSINRFKHS